MKKFFIVLTASFILSAFGAANSFAAGKIKESPDIKITIDGKMGTYSDVPIVQDGRTLLPLRAVLTNLGVQNDDSHIVWNPDERSIMVDKDSKKIMLKVGNKKALVNNLELTLDVPPVIYKSRTYIPARFIAESLGKKVVWDSESRMVLIKALEDYNYVMEVLKRAQGTMKALNKAKVYMNIESEESTAKNAISTKMNINCQMDYSNKMAYMQMNINVWGENVNVEAYYGNNAIFTKGLFSEGWVKNTLSSDEYSNVFKEETAIDFLDNVDTLAAGLVISDKNNSNEIMLTGDIYYRDYSDYKSDGTTNKVETVNKSNVRILIDKKTSFLKNINMEFDCKVSNEKEKESLKGRSNISFNEINGNFQINIPQDVIKTAKEED